MKKFAKYAGLGFLAWYLVTQPHRAANVVHGGLDGLNGTATSLSAFVNDLP